MRILTLILILLLFLPVGALTDQEIAPTDMTEQQAVTIVVNDLRAKLQSAEVWRKWDRRFLDWFTVYELRPHTGYF